jgi:glucokinase
MAENSISESVLAVDLGGSKVVVALINGRGEILSRQQAPTRQLGPKEGIAQIASLLQGLLSQTGVAGFDILGVGIGIPAVLDPKSDHVIWAPNLVGWRDVALGPALEDALDLPVYVEYDGHTAVLGEWWAGAGKGYNSIMDIIIGTGIGGGLILDGRLFRGHDRLAGAAGWFAMTTIAEPADQPGREIGHWESLAAGPGIARRALATLPDYPESTLAVAAKAGLLDAKQVFTAARAGDTLAGRVVEDTARLIGLGIANVVSLINPEIIILGGSIGSQGDLLLSGVRTVVRRWAQPASAQSVHIASSTLGADAGLLGAAYAALSRAESGDSLSVN